MQVDGAGEAVRRRAAFKNAQENRALAIVQNEEKQHAIDEEVRFVGFCFRSPIASGAKLPSNRTPNTLGALQDLHSTTV